MSKNMRPLIFIATPPLKSCPNRMTALCESTPYDSSARHVDPLCISLQATMQAMTLAFSRRHRFLSGRIGTIIAGSGFCCDTRSDAIYLGFTHLVGPQLADEHVHDLRAVDPAPWAKSYVWYTASSMRWILMPLSSMLYPTRTPLHVATIARWQDAGPASI